VAAAAMRATLCPRGTELEVALVDDATIARLNRRFLGHRGPTDVITFPSGTAPGERTLGEVVISVERAREQARLVGWPVRREVALLLVHGILHLRGHDDLTPAAAARMRAREREILAKTPARIAVQGR
jgi:probable rRNA maturation factor